MKSFIIEIGNQFKHSNYDKSFTLYLKGEEKCLFSWDHNKSRTFSCDFKEL